MPALRRPTDFERATACLPGPKVSAQEPEAPAAHAARYCHRPATEEEMTLLEKALQTKRRDSPNPPDGFPELAVAWAKNQITLIQVQAALAKNNTSSTYTALALGLRAALTQGLLVENESVPHEEPQSQG